MERGNVKTATKRDNEKPMDESKLIVPFLGFPVIVEVIRSDKEVL